MPCGYVLAVKLKILSITRLGSNAVFKLIILDLNATLIIKNNIK